VFDIKLVTFEQRLDGPSLLLKVRVASDLYPHHELVLDPLRGLFGCARTGMLHASIIDLVRDDTSRVPIRPA
jgi:hypothetical protein